MNRSLIVDDAGTYWPSTSYDLRRRLQCLRYQGDLVSDIVRNLGFVAITTQQRVSIIRLHRANVATPALAATIFWLADNGPDTVALEFLDQRRPVSTIATMGEAYDHLVTLLARSVPKDRISDLPLEPGEFDFSSPLAAAMELWSQASSSHDVLQRLLRFSELHLGARHYVIGVADGGSPTFAALGRGLLVPNAEWTRSALGEKVESQPDKHYWAWAAQSYRTALENGAPLVSDIDAQIYWPGTGWVRRRYRRLLLPCALPGSKAVLFGASSADCRFDSRADSG